MAIKKFWMFLKGMKSIVLYLRLLLDIGRDDYSSPLDGLVFTEDKPKDIIIFNFKYYYTSKHFCHFFLQTCEAIVILWTLCNI